MNIGFDFGSKNIGYAVVDGGKVLTGGVVPHFGNLKKNFIGLCSDLFKKFDRSSIDTYGITCGSHFEIRNSIDPVIASVEACRFLNTGCRNIISVGHHSFYLVILNESGGYSEHVVNTDCSSGTGSFIDQQAERLGLTTDEMSRIAYEFIGKVPPIATRCTVFAKSDIIHAQASGYSKEAISAGICAGAARCVIDNILKGRKLEGKTLLIGGMAQNGLVVRLLSDEIGKELAVSEHSEYFNAIGSALAGRSSGKDFDPQNIMEGIKNVKKVQNRLEMKLTEYPDFNEDRNYVTDGVEAAVYSKLEKDSYSVTLGIDVGSTSTKLLAMDENEKILLGLYTRTKSEPVKAVQSLFRELGKLFDGKKINFKGVGVTGSGRALVRSVIGADDAVNEITAHARGAAYIDPEVDSIIEIGGQDSKYTIVKDGMVIHTVMNYVCAAGTGSFIEEQAKRLDIPLERLSDMAIGSSGPFTSERCTVYMERDLNVLQSEGYGPNELAAAVLFSVRDNYLSKIVGKLPLGDKIYFQGATAKNKALVAAFENKLGKPILVSKYCHLTGALGAALHVKGLGLDKSGFSGINPVIASRNEVCTLCVNRCMINVYGIDGKETAWGLKCGKDYNERSAGKVTSLSSLERKYREIHSIEKLEDSRIGLKAGIPRTLYMEEYFPLFSEFFKNLGIETVSMENDRRSLEVGKNIVNADFCAPMNIIHGEMKMLLDKNPDFIFFPTMLDDRNILSGMKDEKRLHVKITDSYYCYYSAYAPMIMKKLVTLDVKDRIISPMLKPGTDPVETTAKILYESLSKYKGITEGQVQDAFSAAFRRYSLMKERWIKERKPAIDGNPGRMKIVLFGRPYTVFNSAINSGIPKKFEDAGCEVFHHSMFTGGKIQAGKQPDYTQTMHWHYGQQILAAANSIKDDPVAYPVLITCFRCSPDAYVISYFTDIMKRAGRPYLIIQLDEHGNDTGYQTRIEAAIDSFRNDFSKKRIKNSVTPASELKSVKKISRDETFYHPEYIPVLNDLVKRLYGAYGYKLKLIPVNESDINEGYRHASGGECMPNIAILGSLINTIRNEKPDLEKSLFSATICCVACNYAQFYRLTALALENAGIKGVRFVSDNIAAMSPLNLPLTLKVEISAVSIIAGIMYKLYHKFRPYEINKGDTDKALAKSSDILEKAFSENTGLFRTGKKVVDIISFITGVDKEYGRMKKNKTDTVSAKMLEHSHPTVHLLEALKEIRKVFENIPVKKSEKPRIALIGDLYIKWNSMINQKITDLIEELGGEIIMPSFTEYVSHIMFYDVKNNGANDYLHNQVYVLEKSFENVFSGILDDEYEPDQAECSALVREYGLEHFIPGEVEINAGKILYMHKNKLADAFINVNPVFCCPGVVSSSIFRKMQNDLNIPIIDLFYDGTNRPNGRIIPHMHYLKEKVKTEMPLTE